MAPGDGEESDRCKRGRGAGDCKGDDGENGPDKRFRVAACSACADGEAGDDDTGDYDISVSGDETDGGCAGEDLIYYYSDDDDEEAEVGASVIQRDEKRYVVLSEDDVHDRQGKDTAEVAEVLSVPPGFAAALLRHYRWGKTRLKEEWFTDDRYIRDAVGLPADSAPAPAALGREPLVCAICFGSFGAGLTRAAACSSHFYCDECWRGYIRAAVEDGPRCLSLRCPEPSCSAAVVRELVDAVADGADTDRYAQFALRSYVDESGGGVKWCPGRGCPRAVEFLGCAGDATDVFCDCRHGFCWACGEEAHRPVSCATVRAWLLKTSSDSASTNWVLANTKHCPKCRRPIEKNHGCNHMTCGAPCRHQFCWLCFDPWDNHRGCTRYDYRQRQELEAAAADEEETRRRQAKASLDRYLYHYERWAGNGKSLQKALADADELERSELERMARLVDLPAMELGFVTEAYRQIADGRRVLRWAHAYAYFLFLDQERDAAKRDLFDDLQSQANRWLESLHGCAELERKELFCGADGDGESTVAATAFRAYKEKVANLTGVTRAFMGNLVKAFKTNLPEVVVTPEFDFEHIVDGPTMGSQTAGVGGIISSATVTLEPAALPMVSGPSGVWNFTLIPNLASQGISTLQPSSSSLISQETKIIANESMQEHSPIRNPVHQPVGPGGHGGLLSNLSQFPQMNSTFFGEATTTMGLPNMGAITPLQVHMSNMISSGTTSTPSITFSVSGPGQPIGTELMMVQSTTLGFGSLGSNTSAWDNSDNAASSSQHNSMAMDRQAGINPLSSAMNVPIGLHPNAQQPPPKYVKIWEGTLAGQRQGQPVFISKLESFSGGTVSKTVAADWPETMHIVRLIAQEHMNKKQYVGKADFLVFRTLNHHGFLGQLQEKKLCAVILLPSQTLLLSMSEKPGRLIGMLFPENMVMFKPAVLTQPSLVQQEKLQQQQELLHHQQLQQQQAQHQNIQRLQQQIRQQQQMQQMQHEQQNMQASTQNLPMQQQKLHQQQLQQLHLPQQLMQQQQPRYQQQLWQQMQHQQQLRQQIQQQKLQQQHMQQMQPQQQPLPQMVGTELDNGDNAREDWVTGAGRHA